MRGIVGFDYGDTSPLCGRSVDLWFRRHGENGISNGRRHSGEVLEVEGKGLKRVEIQEYIETAAAKGQKRVAEEINILRSTRNIDNKPLNLYEGTSTCPH